MRVLNWALDAQKTLGGKIISVILSVALIFSFSNFFYGDNAFAEEQEVESNTEVTTEPVQSEPVVTEVVTETEKKSEELQSETPKQESAETSQTEKATTSEDQISTQAENDNSDALNNKDTESVDAKNDRVQLVSEAEGITANWDTASKTITITGSSTLSKAVLNGFTFVNENGEAIDWKATVERIIIRGVSSDKKLSFAPKGLDTTAPFENAYGRNQIFGVNAPNGFTLEIENVKNLPQDAFAYVKNIKECTLKNVDSIGISAFFGCEGMKTVSVTNCGDMAGTVFVGCSSLTSCTIDGLNSTGQRLFGDYSVSGLDFKCNSLKTVTVKNVATVAANTFAYTPSLTTVNLNSVGAIEAYAFRNCTNLSTVNLTDVNSIANFSFYNCKNLTTVNSLNNVKDSIAGFAFLYCPKLDLSNLNAETLCKMGFIGSNESILQRVKAILAGKFNLDDADVIKELGLEEGWAAGEVGKSDNWNAYDNGTQIMEQARWTDENAGVAEVKVDAYYTGEKQMDYIFVADLSASMAQLGNAEDNNARFYDMQSKLFDMSDKLLGAPGYDCQVAVVTFGGQNGSLATHDSSGFMKESSQASDYIRGLEPLNENTDYGLGLQEALKLVEANKAANRNTVVVFLSDGAPNKNTSGDQYGTTAAAAIKELNVPIYGVLHSPTAAGAANAEKRMNDVCDYVYRSTDTESFGNAMNSAFAAAYGDNTVTIPVNARDFNINNLNASAGTAEYRDGVITWTLSGMPFTQHTLTYNMTLNEENATRIGTYEYGLNNGNAHFGDTGASAGLSLSLSRTVVDPVNPDPTPTPNPEPTPTPDPTPTPEPTPTPNPGDGGATTPDDGGATTPVAPAATPAATPAAAPAPAATPAAPAVVIPDEENPLAAPDQEIADDENPLAAFDHEECWVHWFMIAGIILTIIYGAVVVLRRTRNTKHIDKMEKDLIGTTDESTVTVGSAHHSHA